MGPRDRDWSIVNPPAWSYPTSHHTIICFKQFIFCCHPTLWTLSTNKYIFLFHHFLSFPLLLYVTKITHPPSFICFIYYNSSPYITSFFSFYSIYHLPYVWFVYFPIIWKIELWCWNILNLLYDVSNNYDS